MIKQETEQITWCDLGLWSGKTSPEPSPAETPKGQTLRQSSRKSSKSVSRESVCISVSQTVDGLNPGVITLTMAPGALLGEYMTQSFGESPSEENASRLSQILEASPHPKYFLSERACAGILTRAKRRGKKLPEPFEKALLDQASTTH